GVRPRWLFVETVPGILLRDNGQEGEAFLERRAWRDLSVLRHFSPSPARVYCRWCQSRAAPWFTYRFFLGGRGRTDWVPQLCRQEGWYEMIDDRGWAPFWREEVREAEAQAWTEDNRRKWLPIFRLGHVAAAPDRALHALLDRTRREGIPTVLYL